MGGCRGDGCYVRCFRRGFHEPCDQGDWFVGKAAKDGSSVESSGTVYKITTTWHGTTRGSKNRQLANFASYAVVGIKYIWRATETNFPFGYRFNTFSAICASFSCFCQQPLLIRLHPISIYYTCIAILVKGKGSF